MDAPTATYRIQCNPAFGFAAVREVLSYLADLGISDLYLSPIFKAVRGSLHGYDVVDPNLLNPELGKTGDFDELASTLKELQMGWIQDIVPNHMAIDSENRLFMDVLENGSHSRYFRFFDVDWDYPGAGLNRRILAPFLGGFYGESLENGEITIRYGPDGFRVVYYNISFPLRIESYLRFFENLSRLKRRFAEGSPDFIRLLGILYVLKSLSSSDEPEERPDRVRFIRRSLWDLYNSNLVIREFIEETLRTVNGTKGEPESYNFLGDLLSEQLFRLSFWKVAAEEINYRRFFCVNGLISLRMEEEAVFDHTHGLIFDLLNKRTVTGLRIDHIDGLYDPARYLEKVRSRAPEALVYVEKILDFDEELPAGWPIQGTTGYDFANAVNGVFCLKENERAFSGIYARLTGLDQACEEVVRRNKKLMIQEDMASDVQNLAQLLKSIAGRDRHGSDITLSVLQRALTEILAVLPVYRTYISPVAFSETDRKTMEKAVRRVEADFPALAHGLGYVRRFLLLEFPGYVSEQEKQAWLHFVMRFQQLTGPVMAKGVEDTTHYVYNRLVSLNEVGGRPDRFGWPLEEFHRFNRKRAELWPDSLNATSTHDTKRGEDARARINVLSEMPEEWLKRVRTWIRLNRGGKTRLRGSAVPDRNDEYFLYQTLIGAWPPGDAGIKGFLERIREYIVKAVREAKVHTAWLKPDVAYEDAYVAFVEKILAGSKSEAFLQDFLPFCRKISTYGIWNSLSQTLLKMTAPGVPDFYQGSELWNLSLVDPDNRRPVDFERRRAMLADVRRREDGELDSLIRELLFTKEDGKIKLFLIYRVLKARKAHREIFRAGAYLSLETTGQFKGHVIAFARKLRGRWALVAAPRFLSGLVTEDELPLGRRTWGDTEVIVPGGAPDAWLNVITGKTVSGGGALLLGDLLEAFPAALLIGREREENTPAT